ncbi:hypothetical protein [Hoeflea sp.]|uniref:hypothetical protein n=1 Tax=Hoeflea sp. TaxID=1940281 RepID=UPI0019AEE4E2|nr:hypothetical protein [Hoeflea sp.]MBC7280517.1 hypothetical protein [Hoeflea sp.]
MLSVAHKTSGAIALVMIALFWGSTVLSEISFDAATVTAVKSAIPYGFIVLIPALMAAGGSGLRLAGGRRSGAIGTKLKRMPFIAANGLFVLMPAAFFLASKARAGNFDTAFYAVQVLELLAGAGNLALLSLNMRDGLRMTARRRSLRA